jgi:broad specificity phosphatase PhoE
VSDERLVYWVRHGEVHNPGRVRYGRLPGYTLSAAGRAQIEATAQWLAAQRPAPAAVVASPLERATESAAIIATRLAVDPPSVDPRIIEALSRFDGLRYRADPWGHARRWLDRRASDERAAEIAARTLDATLAPTRLAPALVLVSHQLPIQYLRVYIERGLATPHPWSRRPRCATASVTVIAVQGGRASLRAYVEPSSSE